MIIQLLQKGDKVRCTTEELWKAQSIDSFGSPTASNTEQPKEGVLYTLSEDPIQHPFLLGVWGIKLEEFPAHTDERGTLIHDLWNPDAFEEE